MGISHLSIISGLLLPKGLDVYVVDSSFASRLLAKEMVPSVKVFKKLSDVTRDCAPKFFDFCLVTTPPINRAELVSQAKLLAKTVFIEKPLMLRLEDGQMSGYVLQHAPLNVKVFEHLGKQDIISIKARLTTNISFEKVEKGWRSSKFGTVLYEFGGHLLTLISTTCGRPEFLSTAFDLTSVSCDANETDHVVLRFFSAGIDVVVELIAGSTDVRKASYEIEFTTKDFIYTYDLYSLSSVSIIANGPSTTLLNLAAVDTNVPFYVRGFEFTSQMQAFLNGAHDILTVEQIDNIEKIIEGVE